LGCCAEEKGEERDRKENWTSYLSNTISFHLFHDFGLKFRPEDITFTEFTFYKDKKLSRKRTKQKVRLLIRVMRSKYRKF
jgi:hypothetical protein